jgi:Zn-dependent peptidase ImmA (M78 family)
LANTEGEIHHNIESARLSDDPEGVAHKLREKIGIKVETQFSWKKERDAFEEWRKSIERFGVLVFQSSLPVEETRGFSLPGDTFPVIVLNEKDHMRARMFSLFHEFGHLLLDTGGICNWENPNGSPEIVPVEKFCNHFAGAFLVPKDALLNHQLVKLGKTNEWPDNYLQSIARNFKVSREVILRRLVTLNLASWNFYRMKYEEWKKEAEEKVEPKYLFSIGMDYKQYLKGPVSEALVTAFKNNEQILTEDAEIIQKDDTWEIKTKNKKQELRIRTKNNNVFQS